MDNVNNSLVYKDTAQENVSIDEKVIKIRSYQSFNESNLMTLPFISMRRKRVDEINRTWIRDGKEVGLKVVASKLGCPTIYELDVIMGLFKILSKNMNNEIVVSSLNDEKNTKKVTNMPKVINFTYRSLAKEMGLKGFGKATKERLETSIRRLVECTVYSTLAIRDRELGEYIVDFDGLESSRIFKNYKSYSVSRYKKAEKKLLDPKKVEEYQSIEIDDFFFKNLTNFDLKLYDNDKYILLKLGIAKKIMLILTQWSHGNEKYITMQTLYDYIGLEVNTKEEEYYYNQELKKACQELVDVKFIQSYIVTSAGVKFIFNTTRFIEYRGLDKYKEENEIVARLFNIGIEIQDINKFCRMDTWSYVAALLRYIDNMESKGKIDDVKKFTLKGLPYGRYDVKDYGFEI